MPMRCPEVPQIKHQSLVIPEAPALLYCSQNGGSTTSPSIQLACLSCRSTANHLPADIFRRSMLPRGSCVYQEDQRFCHAGFRLRAGGSSPSFVQMCLFVGRYTLNVHTRATNCRLLANYSKWVRQKVGKAKSMHFSLNHHTKASPYGSLKHHLKQTFIVFFFRSFHISLVGHNYFNLLESTFLHQKHAGD